MQSLKNYRKNNRCPDCGIKIHDHAKRCKVCAFSGKNNHIYGKKRSNETKRRISIGRIGKYSDENNPNWKGGYTKVIKNCLDCNKKIGWNKEYCMSCSKKNISNETRLRMRINHANVKLENNPNWRGGKSFEPYPLGWNRTFKEQIRYRDGYKCQMCGVSESECTRRLHIHHIDYVKHNLSIGNLISLCHSCHSKTNHKRDYWINYFKGKICVI